MIARHSNEAFYQDLVDRLSFGVGFRLGKGAVEDDYVAALRVAMMNQRHPGRRRTKCDAIDEQVVTHQKRVLHGPGRNNEILTEKCEDEEPDHENRTDAGERLQWSFFRFRLRRSSRNFGHRFSIALL